MGLHVKSSRFGLGMSTGSLYNLSEEVTFPSCCGLNCVSPPSLYGKVLSPSVTVFRDAVFR